jgi:peptidyl-dipeptidase A
VGKFLADAEKRYLDNTIKLSRASWVKSNFITDDTEALEANTNKENIALVTELAETARKFEGQNLSPDAGAQAQAVETCAYSSACAERRKGTRGTDQNYRFNGRRLWQGQILPDPTADPLLTARVKALAAQSKNSEKKCLDLEDLGKILNESRNPEELKRAWAGWHQVAQQYRQRYARFVELANKGAREMGFKDLGAMWRSNYDMEPDAFAAEMERLWLQVKPLYDSLHTYVRAKLRQKYGDAVPANGPIPAHLLGNMWAQQWGNIYDIVKPSATTAQTYDLTKILQARKTDAKQMVKYGEGFFTSLSFDPLPQSFWERSLFTKPQDREVVCHASAWDIDNQKDVRIKMCININEEDFTTYPSRTRPQLSIKWPTRRNRRSIRTAPMTASRSHRRHDCAVGHA